MFYAPFYELFPELAVKETRTLTVFNAPGIPPGEYGFLELYCNKADCDCRRVMFNVTEVSTGETKAVISYGWESEAFYAQWLGRDDPTVIAQMQGPALNIGSPQSALAPALLTQMEIILADDMYVERLQRHYTMYKARIGQNVVTQANAQSTGKRLKKRPKRPKPIKNKKSRRKKKK